MIKSDKKLTLNIPSRYGKSMMALRTIAALDVEGKLKDATPYLMDIDGRELRCSCGAVEKKPKHFERFRRRHPKLCGERRRFAEQLGAGTRCVED